MPIVNLCRTSAALCFLALGPRWSLAQTAPAAAAPGVGEIALAVDATDLDRKVLRVHEALAVRPGGLRLYFPRWLPGTHSPGGDVGLLAGLKATAGGQLLAWTRDPLDTHAFGIVVPPGADMLDLEFQYLTAASKDSGRVVVTHEMLNVQWNNLVLYPAGFEARALTVRPSLTLPAGWEWAGALRAERQDAGRVQFRPVTLERLVDSPLFAGRHVRRIELDPPGTVRPAVLNLVADRPEQLRPSEAQIEAHRELVRQADKLFASRHYGHYDFLLALTDEMGGIGLEHHESSENGTKPSYWESWDKHIGSRELLPHEYTHSWNGKFRRPADLATPDYNVPMRNSLLWVYEGQTQFWGWVLAARSGLTSADLARQHLAGTAAVFEHRAGRVWRDLQDTTNDPIATVRRGSKDWRDWQRTSGDYYEESLLIWLDADTLIRERSGGTKSLDDFARGFFGVDDGQLGPRPYTFDDIVAALNAVQPFDWATFLRRHLDAHDDADAGVLAGVSRSGWTLAFAETQGENDKARDAEDKQSDLSWSIGLVVGNDGKVGSVLWGSPAFQAGLAPAVTLVAVNLRAYKAELLKDAITGNKGGAAPIELLLRDGENYRSVRIDYRGGLRYPRLERLPGTPDRLTALLARR